MKTRQSYLLGNNTDQLSPKKVPRQQSPEPESSSIDGMLSHFDQLSDKLVSRDHTGKIDFVSTVDKLHSFLTPHIHNTPLRSYPLLDIETGVKSVVKLENIQQNGDVAIRQFAGILISTALECGLSKVGTETCFLFAPHQHQSNVALYLQQLVFTASHLGASSTILLPAGDVSLYIIFAIDNIKTHLPEVNIVFVDIDEMHSKIAEHLTMPNVVYIDGKHMKQQAIIALATIAAETFSQTKTLSKSLSSLVVPINSNDPFDLTMIACSLYVRSAGLDCSVMGAEMVQDDGEDSLFNNSNAGDYLVNNTDDLSPNRVFYRWRTIKSSSFLTYDDVRRVAVKFGDNVLIDFPDQCSRTEFCDLIANCQSFMIEQFNSKSPFSTCFLLNTSLVSSIIQVKANTDCLMGWCTTLRHVKAHVSSKGAAAIASLFHLPQTQCGDDTVTAVLLTGGTVEPYGVGIRLEKGLELMGHFRSFDATFAKDSGMLNTFLGVLADNSIIIHDLKIQNHNLSSFIQLKLTVRVTCTNHFKNAINQLTENDVTIRGLANPIYSPPNHQSPLPPSKMEEKNILHDDIGDVINRVRAETEQAIAEGDIGSEEVGVEDRHLSDVTLDSIKEAYCRLLSNDAVDETFITKCNTYSKILNSEAYLLFDNLQRTGSFKVRGSSNYALRYLENHHHPDLIVACSAGNHAQGVASISKKFGIPAEIIVPMYAPQTKLQSCISLGATVTKHGSSFESAMEFTKEFVRRLNKALPNGALLIHPFNQPSVIEGQGTLIHSFFEQHPEGVDTVVVNIGGGGLATATALYTKEWARRNGREIRVVGVQAERVSPLKNFISDGTLRYIPKTTTTIADGCNVKLPYVNDILRKCLDEIVTVEENEIIATISHVLKHTRTMTEGAGALAFAALLFNKFERKPGERIASILSGSNIDLLNLFNVYNHGLRTLGKVLCFSVRVADSGGHLYTISHIANLCGMDLVTVDHDRHVESLLWTDCILRLEVCGQSFAELSNFLALLVKQGYEPVIDSRKLLPNHEETFKEFDQAVSKLKKEKFDANTFEQTAFRDSVCQLYGL
ncbi:hypothetical protein P9112_008736 [Eukaryota sp. TZLM1-RC]